MSAPVIRNRGTVSPVLGSPALTPNQSPQRDTRSATTHSGALAHPTQSSTAVFTVPAPEGRRPSARILVYGDSLTAGLPSFEPYAKTLVSSLAAEGSTVEVVGCGLCSVTAIEMARGLNASHLKDCTGRTGPGLQRLLTEKGPFDLVMIMAGTNDIAVPENYSVEQILASLKAMHKVCHAAGIPTVAISIPQSAVSGTSKWPKVTAKWHAANKALADWVRAERDITLVDSAQLIQFNAAAVARGLWDRDEIHFSAAGCRAFGSGLAPVIAPLLRGKDSSRSILSQADSVASISPSSVQTEDNSQSLKISSPSTSIRYGDQCGRSNLSNMQPAPARTVPYTSYISGTSLPRQIRCGGA